MREVQTESIHIDRDRELRLKKAEKRGERERDHARQQVQTEGKPGQPATGRTKDQASQRCQSPRGWDPSLEPEQPAPRGQRAVQEARRSRRSRPQPLPFPTPCGPHCSPSPWFVTDGGGGGGLLTPQNPQEATDSSLLCLSPTHNFMYNLGFYFPRTLKAHGSQADIRRQP